MISTKFLARTLGLWGVIAVTAMVANKTATIAMLDGFFADGPLMWITGVFTLLVGIVIVVAHNRWSGGALSVVVTLYGWIALVKGFTFVCLPPSVQAALYESLHFAQYFYAYFVVSLALCGYMLYGGFIAQSTPGKGTG